MPSASVTSAVAVKTGVARSERRARRIACTGMLPVEARPVLTAHGAIARVGAGFRAAQAAGPRGSGTEVPVLEQPAAGSAEPAGSPRP